MVKEPQISVPSFRIEFSDDETEECLAAVEGVLRSGKLILGPQTERFEQEFAKTAGVSHAVAVNSGSTALEIIFRIRGVKGSEVLVPTNTNFATAAAALYAGAEVTLFDSGLYPSFQDVERRITHKTAVVVIVHIGGYVTPEIWSLRDLCERRNIWLVEDAAHAHHSRLGGVLAGSFGHAAAFSFYPTKVLTTGEGGMILTNDKAFADEARCYRDQGKDASGLLHVRMGNSWRMTEIGAALGLAQLARLDADSRRRAEIMERYRRELASCTSLRFPELPRRMVPSGYKCVAYVDGPEERKKLTAELQELGIQIGRPVYEVPLHRQPVFRELSLDTYPVADDFCDRHICLPLWRSMGEEHVRRVVKAVKSVCGGSRK